MLASSGLDGLLFAACHLTVFLIVGYLLRNDKPGRDGGQC